MTVVAAAEGITVTGSACAHPIAPIGILAAAAVPVSAVPRVALVLLWGVSVTPLIASASALLMKANALADAKT
jgi:hypothetical protein